MKAFTLTEILIVIGIIGILTLISMPALRSFGPSLDLNGTARNLISDLRYAQQLSVTEQIDYGIVFSTSTSKYQLIKFSNPEQIIKEKIFPSDIIFQKITGLTNNRVEYNPYGAVKEEGSVYLINSNGVVSIIKISPSGFVKID